MRKHAFETNTVLLPVCDLNAMFTRNTKSSKTMLYQRILSSIREVGLIEPLVVVEKEGRYFIKDGYLRYKALQELNIDYAECLISSDDDVYTYNKRVNPLSASEAHTMINKAITEGVSIDKIAKTLNVEKQWVRQMDNLLVGIAPSLVGVLKQHNVSKSIYEELKKVTQARQIEIVEFLRTTNDFSLRYTRMLVGATPKEQWVESKLPKKSIDEEIKRELAGKLYKMEESFKKATDTFRDNVFNLVMLSGYLRQVISNPTAKGFLDQNYPDILVTFEKIVKDPSLDV